MTIEDILKHWEDIGTGIVIAQCRTAILKDIPHAVDHNQAIEVAVVMAERAKTAEAERARLREENERLKAGLLHIAALWADQYGYAHAGEMADAARMTLGGADYTEAALRGEGEGGEDG